MWRRPNRCDCGKLHCLRRPTMWATEAIAICPCRVPDVLLHFAPSSGGPSRMHVHESIPSLTLIAVLSALTVGCASSFRPADVAGFPDSQQIVGRTPPVSPRPEMTEATTQHAPTSRQVSSWPPESRSPALTRLLPVDGDYSNDNKFARFDEDLPTLTQLPPVEPFDTNPRPQSQRPLHNLFGDLLTDQQNYYSNESLGALAVGFAIGSAVANTKLDASLRNSYQKNIRGTHTDEYSEALHTPKVLGNGYLAIPAFAGAALVGSWLDDVPLGDAASEWGQRSLRTILVGAPPMLAMQLVTGASRPGETDDGSHWKPFQDNNGVSGHSFMGAVPFICAAKMTDNPYWKVAFYVGSTLGAFSRINDDRHYSSQVMLGWWMAYVAASAVDHTQQDKNLTIFPLLIADGVGVGIEYRR